jgi:enediyne polyketide synthase
VAHADGLTLAVAGRGTLGCDMELIAERPSATWRDLLGSERFRLAERIGAESGEDLDAASTRVWAALESLKKAGTAADAPLVLDASPAGPSPPGSTCDGRWILLRSGQLSIGTCVLRARETEQPFCVALLVDSPHRDRVG